MHSKILEPKSLPTVSIICLVLASHNASGQVVLADSQNEFSLVQGQDDWTYGYRNFTADGGARDYDAETEFIPFDAAETLNGNWDLGAGAPWTMLGPSQGHPNGTNNVNEHWAIRRWTAPASEITGPTLLSVSWFIAADNTGGSGTSGQLHHNGTERAVVAIAGNDAVGVTTTSFVTVNAGDHIDLALTPVGPTGNRVDGADGSLTSLVVSTVVDIDNDLLADSWEEVYFPGDLTQLFTGGDYDLDNVNDEVEFANGTNPTLTDTDGDGLEDGWETNDDNFVSGTETGSNPTVADSDGDTISDGDEVNGTPQTNPNLADTDADTFSDSVELIYGTDPNDLNDTPLTEALADSRTQFSGVDGQDGWRWGYRNYTVDGGGTDYDAAADFIPFPVDGTEVRSPTNFWNGANYDWVNSEDPQNPPWTALGAETTHPNGPNNGEEHWTVRRWVVSGLGAETPVRVLWHTRKNNTASDGITGSVHLNGIEVDTQTLPGSNNVGFFRHHYLNVNDGDVIDLVLTPEGISDRTDGNDGSANWMTIDTRVPAVPVHSNGKYFIPVDAVDSEPDGLADFWEEEYFPGDLTQLFTGGDFDVDGLNDEGEQAMGTNPTEVDSDGDLISDGDEVALGTDPCSVDTDEDGYSDGQEVATGHDPLDPASNVESSGGLLADSLSDFAISADPQGEAGWTYGYYNITQNGEPVDTSSFIEFPTDGSLAYSASNFWNGTSFDFIDAGGVGTNPPWTELQNERGHPNGDNSGDVHWTVRRWTAETSAPLSLSYALRKENLGGGSGTTAVILHNGMPLDSITVGGTDGVGLRSWYFINAEAGDQIEIALSPRGTDDLDADNSDGSFFRLWIDSDIPANPFQPDGSVFRPGAGLTGLRILSIDYDDETNQLTLEWTTRPGKEYQLRQLSSTDPVSWTLVGPTVTPDAGGVTQFTYSGIIDAKAMFQMLETEP